jgi:hypothetical protein
MATMPPEMQLPMGAEAEAPAPGKTVCIEMADDGSFSVYEEAAEAAGPAMPGMEGGEGMGQMPMVEGEEAAQGAQSAATVDEALELARQLLSPESSARGAIAKQVWSS